MKTFEIYCCDGAWTVPVAITFDCLGQRWCVHRPREDGRDDGEPRLKGGYWRVSELTSGFGLPINFYHCSTVAKAMAHAVSSMGLVTMDAAVLEAKVAAARAQKEMMGPSKGFLANPAKRKEKA